VLNNIKFIIQTSTTLDHCAFIYLLFCNTIPPFYLAIVRQQHQYIIGKSALCYLNLHLCLFSITILFCFGSCKCRHCPVIESDNSKALVRQAVCSSGGPRGSCFTY
jgi:hypothetical protein